MEHNNQPIGASHQDEKENKTILEEVELVDVDDALEKYDSESSFIAGAGGSKITARVITVLAVCMSLFHLYIASPWGTMPSTKVRAIHLGFVLALIFLMAPVWKTKSGKKIKLAPVDYVLATAGAVACGYLVVYFDIIAARGGTLSTLDLTMGAICILLVLEGARRSVGAIMSVLALLFMAYACLGPRLPDFIMHRGFSIKRIIAQMYSSPEGIFGIPLGTSATTIFLFVLFGAFLAETGLSELFTNLSMALAGDQDGGPAKVSIIASGLLGMINGSAAANVVTTGAFTIPLMKNVGYKAHFAGAVEAVASTGGQIMPPVMGASAFIMAEFLGVPYRDIIVLAIIPAILYYVSLWINVDLEAKRTGLKGYPKDKLPKAVAELKKGGHLLLPIVLLITMMMMGRTASYSAFFSIVALIVISSLKKSSRLSPKKFMFALENGAKQAVSVAIACAVVGIVVGVVNMTGIGLQLANIIVRIAGGNLLATLFLTMIACVVLGMGMPTSAAYIVSATVAVSAITTLGVDARAAHLFVLYFAALSAITPPVALASYAGAGVANADPNKVGWTAVRVGLLAFIIPFMFVYSPQLLMLDGNFLEIIVAFITACIGCYCMGGAMQGYQLTTVKLYERPILLVASLCMIKSGLITDAIGIALLAIVLVSQKLRMRNLVTV